MSFPLPPRIVKKLPIRNSWALTNKILPIPLSILYYFELLWSSNYSVSGFIIFELFTVIFFQDWAGWGIFTVIPGNPRRTKGDSQHLEARPELQDWPRSELFTVKNSRTGPFSNYLGMSSKFRTKTNYSITVGPTIITLH